MNDTLELVPVELEEEYNDGDEDLQMDAMLQTLRDAMFPMRYETPRRRSYV